jgi:hypothetical protein
MAFVNEKISKEDYEKYNLGDLDKRRLSSYSKEWAIDRERERWLRKSDWLTDREENLGANIWTKWDFYRNGYFISVKTKQLSRTFNHEKQESYLSLHIIELEIPQEIDGEKEQILKDLKEAFEESYGDPYYGINKQNKTCKVDLEYEGELI